MNSYVDEHTFPPKSVSSTNSQESVLGFPCCERRLHPDACGRNSFARRSSKANACGRRFVAVNVLGDENADCICWIGFAARLGRRAERGYRTASGSERDKYATWVK